MLHSLFAGRCFLNNLMKEEIHSSLPIFDLSSPYVNAVKSEVLSET